MATASMVMGIVSIVLSCCCFLGFIFGGLAITFSLLSRTDQGFDGKAKAGLITGIVGVVLGLMGLVFWILVFGFSASEGVYGMVPGIQGLVEGGLL